MKEFHKIVIEISTPVPDWQIKFLIEAFMKVAGIAILPEYIDIKDVVDE